MTDLFPNTESKSPRLLWMEKHGIYVWCRKPYGIKPFVCDGPGEMYGEGHTEDEAILDYATANKIKLWNEE